MKDRDQAMRELFSTDKGFAATLVTCFADKYCYMPDGEFTQEPMEWDPEAIQLELEEDLDIKVFPRAFDRLMAGISIVLTDFFWKDLRNFEIVCNVLSGDSYDPTIWDPADAAECAWGITEAMIIEPEETSDNTFSPDIVAYVAHAVRYENIIDPPDVLRLGFDPQKASAASTWQDDAEMYSAILQVSAARSEDIKQMLSDRLGRLTEQLENIKFSRGDSRDVLERLWRASEGGRSNASAS